MYVQYQIDTAITHIFSQIRTLILNYLIIFRNPNFNSPFKSNQVTIWIMQLVTRSSRQHACRISGTNLAPFTHCPCHPCHVDSDIPTYTRMPDITLRNLKRISDQISPSLYVTDILFAKLLYADCHFSYITHLWVTRMTPWAYYYR
jgi:hypothetical protein